MHHRILQAEDAIRGPVGLRGPDILENDEKHEFVVQGCGGLAVVGKGASWWLHIMLENHVKFVGKFGFDGEGRVKCKVLPYDFQCSLSKD